MIFPLRISLSDLKNKIMFDHVRIEIYFSIIMTKRNICTFMCDKIYFLSKRFLE